MLFRSSSSQWLHLSLQRMLLFQTTSILFTRLIATSPAHGRPTTLLKTMATNAQPELASGWETDHGIVLEGRRKVLVEDALSVSLVTVT